MMERFKMTLRQDETDRLEGLRQNGLSEGPRDRTVSPLDFPPETESVLTSFREKVLNDIYRAALRLSAGQLESAAVSLSSTPDEGNSLHLDLTLTVNADWDTAQALARKILDRVSEWSEEDQKDYGRWIYFGVIPAEL